jgi:hypothetical protein
VAGNACGYSGIAVRLIVNGTKGNVNPIHGVKAQSGITVIPLLFFYQYVCVRVYIGCMYIYREFQEK